MEPLPGFEPETFALPRQRSNLLSYRGLLYEITLMKYDNYFWIKNFFSIYLFDGFFNKFFNFKEYKNIVKMIISFIIFQIKKSDSLCKDGLNKNEIKLGSQIRIIYLVGQE